MPITRTRYEQVAPLVTRDGSLVRELMHPAQHGNHGASFAEATVAPGKQTLLHRHLQSEEIYHFTTGWGRMLLGDEEFPVQAGDTVCIPPGTAHRVENSSTGEMRILCCCVPAYSHADTELLEDGRADD